MKVAIINFSGNVGKTTVARQLLAPRMDAPEFTIETINAGASDESAVVERMKGKDFGSLQEELMLLDSAIVDIGASNVEQFIKLMGKFDGSHEEFDFYVVPVVPEKKQQADTLNTIRTLANLGVPRQRIRVLFNKVDDDDIAELREIFAFVFGLHDTEACFTLNRHAVIFHSEIYDRLRALKKTVAEIAADATDYRTQLNHAPDEEAKEYALGMVSAQRLARSAQRNLDAAYAALFA